MSIHPSTEEEMDQISAQGKTIDVNEMLKS